MKKKTMETETNVTLDDRGAKNRTTISLLTCESRAAASGVLKLLIVYNRSELFFLRNLILIEC